jgi:hypothetical protein
LGDKISPEQRTADIGANNRQQHFCHNARLNINSTNQVIEDSKKVFSELAEVLRQNVNQSDVRDKLVTMVEEMRRGAIEGTFTEKYRKFIAAAADHMTIVAPFLPALSQLL